MTEFELLLRGYRPTLAEILYHIPDHPVLLQSFVWQRLDLAPRFPVLCHFLDFWQAIIGPKGVKNGVVEVKHRATGERVELSVDAALARLTG